MRKLLCIFCAFCLCSACTQEKMQKIIDSGLGTYYQITYIGKENGDLPRQIDSLLHYYNHEFSIFDTLSTISKINASEEYVLNDVFVDLVEQSLLIARQTKGAFDITIGPLVSHWGFGREEFVGMDSAIIDSLRLLVGFEKIMLRNDTLLKSSKQIELNVNAIAKGFIVDRIADFMKEKGFNNFIVDVGGEMICIGTKNGSSWQVGIQTPTEDRNGDFEAMRVFPLTEKAVATSGNYRNYIEENGERYTHIINPLTGYPQRNSLLSVTVIADQCATADALATAFMVMGMEESLLFLSANPHCAALFIYAENGKLKTKQSGNFLK